jgi:hypothetical protein
MINGEESLKLDVTRGITYGHIKPQPVLSDECYRANQDKEHSQVSSESSTSFVFRLSLFWHLIVIRLWLLCRHFSRLLFFWLSIDKTHRYDSFKLCVWMSEHNCGLKVVIDFWRDQKSQSIVVTI